MSNFIAFCMLGKSELLVEIQLKRNKTTYGNFFVAI